jgi:hypothetical protein
VADAVTLFVTVADWHRRSACIFRLRGG